MTQSEPYGLKREYGPAEFRGKPYCINADPGTFGHECQKPATWIGTKASGFQACFCDDCKANGYEAKGYVDWRPA